MAENDKKQEQLINNIGGYVIKVGNVFIGDYRREFPAIFSNMPNSVVPRLSKVREVLHDKNKAQSIAKDINGKVYQICVEPVEDD